MTAWDSLYDVVQICFDDALSLTDGFRVVELLLDEILPPRSISVEQVFSEVDQGCRSQCRPVSADLCVKGSSRRPA